MRRRTILASTSATLFTPLIARAVEMPGITATEIKIGNTMPYSGPASGYATIGKAEAAYFRMLNEQGGINGRKVNFITLDDQASPPKTVEQVRRLVEQDEVALLFNDLGTASNSAIVKYVNLKKVPHLFLATGADKWGDYKDHPWTIGWQPSYRVEAQIYAKYIRKMKPDGHIGIIYQNDDFGKDYIAGLRDVIAMPR
jgi:branched-chain amino acid transport system substrate-binding protein